MKTKTIELYTYDELTPEAKKKALKDYRENNDYAFLSEYLNERLHELLEENGIKDTNDTSKAGTTPTPVRYSLSYSQGDGAMFEGQFEWGTWHVSIKHLGRYSHSNSKEIDMYQIEDDSIYPEQHTIDKFEAIYQSICKTLEEDGYSYIEYEDSEENFIEMCNTNEDTFLSTGVMENY